MAKQVFFRRKKACPFSGEDGLKIDYKDVKLLSRYISEKGKIIPSRIKAVSTKKQIWLCFPMLRLKEKCDGSYPFRTC